MRIRRATLADLPHLLELEAHFPSDRMTPRAWRRFLSATTAEAVVAVEDGAVLGNLLLLSRKNSQKARIYSVIVAPQARGRGLGEKLVAAGEQVAARRGCAAVSLEVRADNPAALALYAKRGYAQTLKLPGYYDDGTDGLRFVKALVE